MSIYSLEAARQVRLWTPAFRYSLEKRDLSFTGKDEVRRGPIKWVDSKDIQPTQYSILRFYIEWVALQTQNGSFLEAETTEWPGMLAVEANTENINPQIAADGTISFWKVLIHPKDQNLQKPRFRTLVVPEYAVLRQEDW